MMTLHDTIELTKKTVLFGTLAVIGILILYFLFRLGGYIKNTFFPTPPPAAVTAFGKLPTVPFEGGKEEQFAYTLDTLTGAFPPFPDRANVYKIVEPLPEFFDLTRAKTKARQINFTVTPTLVAENVYEWSEDNELQRKLLMNIVMDDFFLTSDYANYPPIQQANNLPSIEIAKGRAKDFLEAVNAYPDTINEASTTAKILSLQGGSLVEASSISTAQIIRVDFYHTAIDTLPIYFPNYPDSLMYVLIGGGDSQPTIVEAGYVNQLISDEFSDYPIKTAEEAFTELKAGKGHIASYFGDTSEVQIKNISLGYYLGEKAQKYLMPIVVFEGNNGFIAYVSAVKNDFIE